MTSGREVLRKLQTLGARVELRGDQLLLCVGNRIVPEELVRQARAAKTELLALLAKEAATCAGAKNSQVSCGFQGVSPS
jgi:hypothetical protein